VRIALLTPLLEASAIGRVMGAAADELARRHDVEIWAPRLGPRRRVGVPVREFDAATPMLARDLEGFDLAIYAVGDSPWHVEIVKLARVIPGLVVLHDVSIANLGVALYGAGPRAIADDVGAWYGADVGAAFTKAMADPSDPSWIAVCARAPMVEQLLYGSLGMVVHSAWAAGHVEGVTLGDATVAPLPVEPVAEPTTLPGALGAVPDEAVVLATIGYVNSNRRIDAMIAAIAGDRALRERVHLAVVGDHSTAGRQAVLDMADRAALRAHVHVTGRVDDGQLAAVLARADVCAALRDPVLEAKSASLLAQMRAGRPVLVLDHAHYSELPDDVVVKVPMPGSAGDIGTALRALLGRPDHGAELGARARAYVEEQQTAGAYADAIAAAAERALATRPRVVTAMTLGDRAERAGLRSDTLVRDLLAATIDELVIGDADARDATGAPVRRTAGP
jgi:glycosyltransferase involved in cell wall biosynthesis